MGLPDFCKFHRTAYYLARLLNQKKPQYPVDSIAKYIQTLTPAQVNNLLINNGIRGDEQVTDPNFGLPYSMPAKRPAKPTPAPSQMTQPQPNAVPQAA